MDQTWALLFILLSVSLAVQVIDTGEAATIHVTSHTTIIESSTLIESCFSSATSLSISSCSGLNITQVPTCVSTVLTAFTTIANSSSNLSSLASSSTPQTSSWHSSSNLPNSTVTGWLEPTSIAINGLCGETTGQTCLGSTWGNCCSASGRLISVLQRYWLTNKGDCGHNAFYCGIGCQNEYGYCSRTSIDGSCGNGVSCLDTVFGHCCSASYYCGNGTEYCGDGCQPEFGYCGLATSTSLVPSTSWSSSVSSSSIVSSSNFTNMTNSTFSTFMSGSSSASVALTSTPGVW